MELLSFFGKNIEQSLFQKEQERTNREWEKVVRGAKRYYRSVDDEYPQLMTERERLVATGQILIINDVLLKGIPFPPLFSSDFVVLANGTVIFQLRLPGIGVNHAVLANGEEIVAAGIAFSEDYTADEVYNPKRPVPIKSIMNWSGHFRPSVDCLDVAEVAFRRLHIPLVREFQKKQWT